MNEEVTKQENKEIKNFVRCNEVCVDEFSECANLQRSGKCLLESKAHE
jgi:hypothetical protein